MKLCSLPPDCKAVRIPRLPEYNILDFSTGDASPVDLQVDTLPLEMRDLNGTTRMVAYDRLTDTLYIAEAS